MRLWRKQSTRYLDSAGRRVPSSTLGSRKVKTESRRWYANVRMSDGRHRQTPLTEDRKSSGTLARRLQAEQDSLQASGLTSRDLERLKPICELLDRYERHLTDKRNTPAYVDLTMGRIRRVVDALGAKRVDDLDAGEIQSLLASWRATGVPETRQGRRVTPISVESSNHYLRACRSLSRWLWNSGTTSEDILRSLKILNSRPDLRRVRRALTESELSRLIRAARESEATVCGLCPEDRGMLYVLASFTGLRASELASLCPQSLDLESQTILVQASYSKHRREDVVPLHASLVPMLEPWLSSKECGEALFPGRWAADRRGGKMLQADLKVAGIEYKTDQGYCDFHSLRHTYISGLIRSGVHIAVAQQLARHADVSTTMRYTHHLDDDLRAGLAKLPGLS